MRIPGLSITMSVPDYPLQSSLHAPADTSRSIQVIGAGFSRTGTASFTLAVERLLGGPVCHGGSASVLREEGFIKGWVTTTNPELDDEAVKANLKKLLAGYVGVTDNPCAMFVKELVEMYPDAKVICTTRDPESWYRSIQGIVDQANLGWMDVCFSIIPTLRFIGAWRRGMKARRSVIYPESNDIPEGSHFLAHYGKDVLEIHHSYLKRVVPPEKLFFVDVKDGWIPLCQILGCPIPDAPFPRANDQAAMSEAFKSMRERILRRWLGLLSVSALLLGIGVYKLRLRSWR